MTTSVSRGLFPPGEITYRHKNNLRSSGTCRLRFGRRRPNCVSDLAQRCRPKLARGWFPSEGKGSPEKQKISWSIRTGVRAYPTGECETPRTLELHRARQLYTLKRQRTLQWCSSITCTVDVNVKRANYTNFIGCVKTCFMNVG